jgi:voltage-gated potassium channel
MALRKRLLLAGGLLLSVIAISMAGYRVLGGGSVGFLQALYMAVITLAGVGYGEVVDTSHNPLLRVFNIGVVLIGVTITVYVFSVVAAFLVEVETTNPFWRRAMQKRINQTRDHFIVCGLGDTGRHAAQELHKTGTPHVVVELAEETIKRAQELYPETFADLLYVIGDATEEEQLERAGVERARGIIAALPHDKDNLVITVVIHQRFPKIRIVARSADEKFSDRMLRAGAQSTVSPSRIGGLRLASEVLRPHVVGFLDLMLREQSQTLRVDQIDIAGPPWAGLPLARLNLQTGYNLLVLAAKSGESPKLWVNPPDSLVVGPGTAIIVMGDVKDVQRARQEAAGTSAASAS